MDTCGLAAR